MPIQFDKFDQTKIDRLENHLKSQAEKGTAKFYEIFVDNLKAVLKTDEPKDFEGYVNYMTEESKQIKIVIYNSGNSPRNDQYVFSIPAKSPQEALELGLDGVALRMLSKNEISELKFNRDLKLAESQAIQELNEDIDKLEAEIEEKDKYITILENGIEQAKANGNKLGGIDLSLVVSKGLEGFIRNNTKIISQVKGLEGVAKLIDEDTLKQQGESESPEEPTQVSFTKKSNSQHASKLTEVETQFLGLFHELQKKFNEQEIYEVIMILDLLSQNKEQVKPVLQLLEDKTPNA